MEKLAKIGPLAAEHAEVVATYLDDEDWMIRRAAAEALGAMGKASAAQAPKVAAMLGDRTLQCRKAAIEALAQMGQKADSKFGQVVGRLIGNNFGGSCDVSESVRWAAMTHLPVMGW